MKTESELNNASSSEPELFKFELSLNDKPILLLSSWLDENPKSNKIKLNFLLSFN